jgi:hypothetical protein
LYETWEDSFQLLFRWEEAVLEKMSDSVIEFDVEVNTIAYKIVWKGKDKALTQLYGTWEDSFQLLFRWKEAVMEKMSNSVIEFDVEVKDEKFSEGSFVLWTHVLKVFMRLQAVFECCVDSTALNKR